MFNLTTKEEFNPEVPFWRDTVQNKPPGSGTPANRSGPPEGGMYGEIKHRCYRQMG